jgi:hypothetical protein
VILDTNGNIFGGFTPVKWGFGDSWKADDSLKSFLFTLKNPHNIPPRKFALKAEEKHRAIACDSTRGPWFDCSIAILDKGDSHVDNTGSIGHAYNNNSGRDGGTLFTGSGRFQLQEIEVFELTN